MSCETSDFLPQTFFASSVVAANSRPASSVLQYGVFLLLNFRFFERSRIVRFADGGWLVPGTLNVVIVLTNLTFLYFFFESLVGETLPTSV